MANKCKCLYELLGESLELNTVHTKGRECMFGGSYVCCWQQRDSSFDCQELLYLNTQTKYCRLKCGSCKHCYVYVCFVFVELCPGVIA